MRETRRKATAILVVLQLVATSLLAQSPDVLRLFPAQPVGYVNDFASVIDQSSSADMEALATRLRSATGAELAVVTLPTIDDRSPNEVGVAIIRRWGIGAKANIGDPRRNAGLVVLLVPRQQGQPNSGKIYVAVGQGLEGIITDAAAGEVSDLMVPYLSRGEYGPGLLTGVRSLTARIARAYGVTDTTLAGARPMPVSGPNSQIVSLFPILLFIIFALLASRGGRRRRVYWGGPWIGGGWGGGGGGWGGGGFGGGGFGGFGGGGGASGGGAGRSF